MSLEETQKQLADVMELLRESPDDESLLSLKIDLEELIRLCAVEEDNQTNVPKPQSSPTAAISVAAAMDAAADKALSEAIGFDDFDAEAGEKHRLSDTAITMPSTEEMASQQNSKKQKLSETFEVPAHLVVTDADNDAEKNKKWRKIKKLKSQYKAAKNENESQQKQKTWQSFQKKKTGSKIKETSMFSTSDDAGVKVGVVSSRAKQIR
jgi:hypothetical protein